VLGEVRRSGEPSSAGGRPREPLRPDVGCAPGAQAAL